MSFNVSVPTRTTWVEYNWDGSTTIKAVHADTGMKKALESRVGVRRHKPTGWLFPTEYYLTVSTTRAEPGEIVYHPWTIRYENGRPIWLQERNVIAPYPAVKFVGELPSSSSNMRNKAVTRALLKLKGQRIDLSIAMVEYKETARFIGGGFTTLAESILNFKAGNLKESLRKLGVKTKKDRSKLKRRLKKELNKNRASNWWLQWQYAARPLMNDIDGACTELTKRDKLTDWVTTVKAVNLEKGKDRVETDFTDLNLYSQDSETETFLGYFVRLDFIPSNTFLSTLSRVGATNPLSTLYNATRFSFVLDWAVGIGDWLSAMDATLGYEFLSGSITEKREYREHVRGSGRPLNWGSFMARDPSPFHRTFNGNRRILSIVRTPYTDVPFPLPVYKSPVSLSHVASGLALLTTAITRR